MRHWYDVGLGGVLGLQKQTAQSCLHRMERVTCRGLLRLKQDDGLKTIHDGSESSARLVHLQKVLALNFPGAARYLHYRMTR
jgi:hypothetical protein